MARSTALSLIVSALLCLTGASVGPAAAASTTGSSGGAAVASIPPRCC